MSETEENPTQVMTTHRSNRCEHGFLSELRLCPVCFPKSLTANPRIRASNGQFRATASEGLPDGYYRCWRCGKVKPLQDFSRCASKRNGHLSRCKKCDNSIHAEKKRKPEGWRLGGLASALG